MCAERATRGGDGDAAATQSLYAVRVQDRVDARIAGNNGCAYVSPPAPRDSARALVGLLLGGDPQVVEGGAAWTRAVPGGQRTITLELAPALDRTG